MSLQGTDVAYEFQELLFTGEAHVFPEWWRTGHALYEPALLLHFFRLSTYP